jgi:hypothetical protein
MEFDRREKGELMPTPEEIIRRRMVAEKTERDRLAKTEREELARKWDELKVSALETARRLEAKGYPGGRLSNIRATASRKGRFTAARKHDLREIAVWEISSFARHSRARTRTLFVAADGALLSSIDSFDGKSMCREALVQDLLDEPTDRPLCDSDLRHAIERVQNALSGSASLR